MTFAERLTWVSPMPPVASGISQYSEDILKAVAPLWPVSLLPEPGSAPFPVSGVSHADASRRARVSQPIYHLGNSGFHEHAFRLARVEPGITVLHDVVLHHARLAALVRRGRGSEYRALMEAQYGAEGRAVAAEVLKGASIDLSEYPLSEDYLNAAKVAVVHSEHARERVARIAPAATVRVVPMGVPLPVLYPREVARAALDVPQDAFVITSITHVNPMKRLHIVLRALRRVIERVPETLFIIAGSVAEGMNLERQVALLGLERHVRIVGYLSDLDSRALARAADVSVNLRYPSAGETSASLLRLLGAARPVIITAHGPALEIPEHAALRVPVDRYEEETLAEYLVWLAQDETARDSYGSGGRSFVEANHSMGATIDGYRQVIHEGFGLDLPGLESGDVHEEELPLPPGQPRAVDGDEPTTLEATVADALADLGLANHNDTIQSVARSVAELGLQHGSETDVAENANRTISPELLELLACPVCKTPVRLEDEELVCEACGRHYRIENGIPVMLIDDMSE